MTIEDNSPSEIHIRVLNDVKLKVEGDLIYFEER